MISVAAVLRRAGHPLPCGDLMCSQTPRKHQVEDLGKCLSWERSCNFSEVGTGKSLVSFLYMTYFIVKFRHVAVVMPPALIPQYIGEFKKIIVGHDFWLQNLSIPKSKRDKVMDQVTRAKKPEAVFLSYVMFTKMFQELADLGYTVLIADESHNACNPKTKNFKSISKFLRSNEGNTRFMSMTGTPCPTELRSSYGHIKLKTPDLYKTQAAFDRAHVIWHEYTDFPKIVGYKNKDVLEENMNRFSVRRRARDVLSLKDPVVMEQFVDLSFSHMALYKKLLKEMILEIGDEIIDGSNPSKLRVLALMLITSVQTYTEKKIEDMPLNMLKAILDSLGGKKLLVFCHFRATIEKLAEEFKHLNPALMYGGSDVPANADKFNHDSSCRIAFLNYKSGGAGLNLQSQCHNTVFFESTGSQGEYIQAVGRTNRSGQKEVCNVWVFRYRGTISERLIDSALGRSKDIKQVMRDKASILDALGV